MVKQLQRPAPMAIAEPPPKLHPQKPPQTPAAAAMHRMSLVSFVRPAWTPTFSTVFPWKCSKRLLPSTSRRPKVRRNSWMQPPDSIPKLLQPSPKI